MKPYYKAMFILEDKTQPNGYATENYDNLDIADFEVIYGQETRIIVALTLVKQGDDYNGRES